MVRSDGDGTNPDLESLQAGCSDSGLSKGEEEKSYTLSIQNKLTHFYKLDKPDTASSFKPIPQHTKLRGHEVDHTHQLHIYIYAEKLTPVSALFGGIFDSALKTADRQPICH